MQFLCVGLGGFLGALARYLINLGQVFLGWQGYPYATLAINLSGCFFGGILLGVTEKTPTIHHNFLLFASVGFLGAFTTFSTFGIETFNFIRTQNLSAAFSYIGISVIFGIIMIWAGRFLALSF